MGRVGISRIKSRPLRGRVVRSLAKTTKGGKGKISSRKSYKTNMVKLYDKKGRQVGSIKK